VTASTGTGASGSATPRFPPLQRGSEVVRLGGGVTFRVPQGWAAEKESGLVLAGSPSNRDADYTNVFVAPYADDGNGNIVPLPTRPIEWLRSRRRFEVRDAGPISVDGRQGILAHVAATSEQRLFCAWRSATGCFSTGAGGVDYGLLELGPKKLLVIEGPSPARVRELAKFVDLP
jgi:hypothetical protein